MLTRYIPALVIVYSLFPPIEAFANGARRLAPTITSHTCGLTVVSDELTDKNRRATHELFGLRRAFFGLRCHILPKR